MRTRIIFAVLCAALIGAAFTVGAQGKGKGKEKKAAKQELRGLFAGLNGKREVDAVSGKKGAGDTDGFGTFSASVDGDQLCFGITVKNLDAPAAAHIHRGGPDENGPVVVTLAAPDAGDPGTASDCVTVDPTVSAAILRHPRRYYTNVHTSAFPGGAVRGQLHRRR